MKLVYIEWEDSSSHSSWHTREELRAFIDRPCVIRQVGWVYEETPRYLVLVSRHAPAGVFLDDLDESFGNLQRIPITWIQKRIDLTDAAN